MKILENERVRDLLVAIDAETKRAAKRDPEAIPGMTTERYDALRGRVATADLVTSGLIRMKHDQRPVAGGRVVVILTDSGQMITDVIRLERKRCDALREFDADCAADDARLREESQ